MNKKIKEAIDKALDKAHDEMISLTEGAKYGATDEGHVLIDGYYAVDIINRLRLFLTTELPGRDVILPKDSGDA